MECPYPTNWGPDMLLFVEQVTSEGTGLNPNAKVWQEIPSGNPDGTPVTETSWHETEATSPRGQYRTFRGNV